jgi:DNA-binding XRE family transcriptional regulator
MKMSRLKYYRMEAGLSVAQLARLAQVDETTCRRAETGRPVQELKAYAIAKALSQAYGQELSIEMLEIVIYS